MGRVKGVKNIKLDSVEKFKKDCVDMRLMEVCVKYGISLRSVNTWKRKFGLTDGKMPDRKITWCVDENDCWICTSHKCDGRGYPAGNRLKGRRSIAKVMYEREKGKFPRGKVIMHECDNRMCINPKHLSAGSQTDNLQDMWRKGRGACGEKHGQSVLTLEEVKKIRSLKGTMSYAKMAKMMGRPMTTVYCAAVGRSWNRSLNESER